MTTTAAPSSDTASSPDKTLPGTIGFLGTGNMAEALIKGLLAAGLVKPEQIWGSDPRQSRCQQLRQQYGINMTTHNVDVVRRAGLIVLSVKPQVLLGVMDEVGPYLKPHCLCISVAAGVPLQVLQSHLPKSTRVIRVMPNTPALVGAGATAISAGNTATEDDIKLSQQIFGAIGFTVVLDEDQLDAVTGLSGSGPAYMFLVIEALSDAGVKVGLSRYNAVALAAHTVLGSAKLLLETGQHPGHLKDMVTSPGGTAIAGLHTLEAGGLRTTLINAVEAATRRSKELGDIAIQNAEKRRQTAKES
ncbi:MAG TPA: pyrroline-5-carboxylate reductase [Pseudomonadota bacterium]|nr:pyrroline-5-carboxylate reductase [Pseudomonadota bacterium]HNN49473.1 pyrroline-5-carboxylate reductase [Pseudomonadota bacterium]